MYVIAFAKGMVRNLLSLASRFYTIVRYMRNTEGFTYSEIEQIEKVFNKFDNDGALATALVALQ